MASSIELDEGIIDVWTLSIQSSEPRISDLFNTLSLDERARARAFRFDHLRRSFIVTRGTLRALLGRYLSIAPREMSFSNGPDGKPYVSNDALVHFNTAHSGGIALFAFTREYEIGVDVEQIKSVPHMSDLIRQFCCSVERAEFASISEAQREKAFFRWWARKEAYVKAIGTGLSTRLDSFCVTINQLEAARLVHINEDRDAAQAWTLQDLPISSRHAAAIAYRGASVPIRLRSLDTLDILRD